MTAIRRPGAGPGPDVVHVVCTDAFAGVERYVTTLARTQDDAGTRVLVLGGSPDRMPVELAGTRVGWASAGTVRRTARTLRALRPQVVHAHMTAAELAAVLAARAPVVVTRHFAARRGSSATARAAGRFVTRRVAAQVAISTFVADRVEGPSTVAHPGVPTVEASDTLPPAGRAPVVLIAQRLEPEKRTALGLHLWAASGLADHGWRLDIAGDGVERPHLTALADRLGLGGSVRFLGARPDADALMSRAAVLLAPRPDEPYGLSVVEAMAHATPVVAARGGGHDETVGTVPGAVLVDPGDPAAAGAALAALALDPARRADYGTRLQDAQRTRFDLAAHADQVAAVYRTVRR